MKAPSLREQNNKLRKEFQTAHLELCTERINRGITHSVLKAKNTAIKRLTNEVADLTVRLADAKAIAKGTDRLCSVLIVALEKYQEKPANVAQKVLPHTHYESSIDGTSTINQ